MASAAGAETQNSYSHLLTHSLKHTHTQTDTHTLNTHKYIQTYKASTQTLNSNKHTYMLNTQTHKLKTHIQMYSQEQLR